MPRGPTGHFVPISTTGETARAFIPHSLPPDPPLDLDGALGGLLDAASTAIGRLDGISLVLPDPELFLYTYIRQEAVLSSQIEGTQSSLSDLMRHELDGAPPRCSRMLRRFPATSMRCSMVSPGSSRESRSRCVC